MRYRHILRTLILSIPVTSLLSCTLQPGFSRPDTPVTQQQLFINADADTVEGRPVLAWWKRLDDPLLNDYIDELLRNNPSIREASERVIQARERYKIQGGSLLPEVNVEGGGTRSFSPTNSFVTSSFPAGAGPERIYNTSLNAELSVSWQVDLFGRIRSSVAAAESGYIASVYDREAVQQSLIADLLMQRVGVAINARLLELANEVAAIQQALYRLVQRRYELGTRDTTATDLYLADENLNAVRADVHLFERQLAVESYGLDVLLGRNPGSTNPRATGFNILPPPRDIVACLPVDLLDRRPDLRASELRMAAANAEIGIALADLYPGLNLGAGIGFRGNNIENLFSVDQLAGSLLGTITARIFQGGALRANIRLQESEARELASRYTGQVLEAMREVESALKAENELEKQMTLKQQSIDSIQKAESFSRNRYREGVIGLREYLQVQQRMYQVEQEWLRLQQERWNNRINLYLALGGDWFADRDEELSLANDPCSMSMEKSI